jgi:transposase
VAKTKLTPKVRDAICEAVRAGNYLKVAASAGGVTEQTIHNWIARGRDEKARVEEGHTPRKIEAVFLDFFEHLTRAEDQAEADAVRIWREQMPDDWRAAKEYLARRFGERWGDKQRVEMTGKDGGPVEQRITGDTEREKVTSMIDELAARRVKKDAA